MASFGDDTRNVYINFNGRDNASTAMRSIGNSATRTSGIVTKLTAVLKAAAIAAATALAAAAAAAGYFAIQFVKASVEAAGNFEQSMNVLQNALGATGDQMKEVEKFALRMGSKTVFSAQQAGDAMIELARAGLSQAQIKAGALASTMSVAATEGLDLADTARIMASTMSVFNIKASKSAFVADALAGASGASTASVSDLSIALSQAGTGAADAGLSLNETVGALAAFADAGIRGSDAGTSLKTMLTRLVPMTDKAATAMSDYNLDFTDAKGNFVSITDMADQLAKGLGDLSDKERTAALTTIFGSDARRAATILMNQGRQGLEKFIKSTRKQGAAAKMAEARMKGWNGAVETLQGAWETFMIKFGKKLLPMLAKFARYLAETVVPAISKHLVPWVRKAAAWLGENLPKAADKVREWWAKSGKEAWTQVWEKTKDITGSIGDLVHAIVGGGEGEGEGATSAVDDLTAAFEGVADILEDVIGFLDTVVEKLTWIQEREPFGNMTEWFSNDDGGLGPLPEPPGWWPGGEAAGGWLKRAQGGWGRGWTMVGEHGPELISNRGFVKPHSASMGGAGGGNVYVTVQGAVDPVGTARQIRAILAKGDRASGRGALGLA